MHQFLPYRPERDVYRLLQVDPTADAEQVTAACRRLARHFHPDRNGSPRANEEMQVVNAVRELLADRALRAAYDGSRQRYLERRASSDGVPARTGPRVEPRTIPVAGSRPVPLLASSAASASAAASAVASAAIHGARRLGITARAVARGLQAAVAGPMAPRCPGCEDLVDDEDRYCGGCGTWLGRGDTGAEPLGDARVGGRFGVGSVEL
ncbi:MAG: DnaJ domain-containing protein [Candidatus Limnocylindria bacterium]